MRRPDLFMTDAATILAQQRNRFLSYTIHGKYYNKSWGWTIYLGAEADDLRVISKEALGNSWGILSAMLGHKYHQNHPETEMWVWSHLCLSVCVRAIDVWSRPSFRVTTCTLSPSWLSGMWVCFLLCTIHVVTDFSYFKQYFKNVYLFSRVINTLLPLHLFIRHSKLQDQVTFASTQNVKLICFNKATINTMMCAIFRKARV